MLVGFSCFVLFSFPSLSAVTEAVFHENCLHALLGAVRAGLSELRSHTQRLRSAPRHLCTAPSAAAGRQRGCEHEKQPNCKGTSLRVVWAWHRSEKVPAQGVMFGVGARLGDVGGVWCSHPGQSALGCVVLCPCFYCVTKPLMGIMSWGELQTTQDSQQWLPANKHMWNNR